MLATPKGEQGGRGVVLLPSIVKSIKENGGQPDAQWLLVV